MACISSVDPKQPAEVLDYDVLLAKWMVEGDSIVSVSATADTGLTVEGVSFSGTTVKVWVSGGTDGNNYKVTVKALTNDGRLKEVDFTVRVREK